MYVWGKQENGPDGRSVEQHSVFVPCLCVTFSLPPVETTSKWMVSIFILIQSTVNFTLFILDFSPLQIQTHHLSNWTLVLFMRNSTSPTTSQSLTSTPTRSPATLTSSQVLWPSPSVHFTSSFFFWQFLEIWWWGWWLVYTSILCLHLTSTSSTWSSQTFCWPSPYHSGPPL